MVGTEGMLFLLEDKDTLPGTYAADGAVEGGITVILIQRRLIKTGR